MKMQLSNIAMDVERKEIKNVHLSVYPPRGRVRIAAPIRMSLDTIRVFAIAKLPWIRRQQQKLRMQERETLREYLDRESHYVWGRRYLLRVIEANKRPEVSLRQSAIFLTVRPKTTRIKRREIMENWYREQLRQAAMPLIAEFESMIRVKVSKVFIQHMKTKWGSCNRSTGSIRLNTELAKKSHDCLKFIIAHELIHLIERTHNKRFIDLMDKYMPKWQSHRQILNSFPVSHESWAY